VAFYPRGGKGEGQGTGVTNNLALFFKLVRSEERGYIVRSRIEVGDLVLVRRDGRSRSAAARKYAGKKGQVTMRGEGHDRTVVDVRIAQNNFDTVFEEQDLIKSLSIS
jgi:hypothetical protein